MSMRSSRACGARSRAGEAAWSPSASSTSSSSAGAASSPSPRRSSSVPTSVCTRTARRWRRPGCCARRTAGLFAEGEPEERAFNLLARALREIDAGFAGRALRAPLVLGGFVKLLSEAGYLPVLDQCVACGATDGMALAFSAARGGLLCERCLHEGVPITPDAVEWMRRALGLPLAELRALPGDEGVEEAFRHLHALYAYHTGAQLRSLRFARA